MLVLMLLVVVGLKWNRRLLGLYLTKMRNTGSVLPSHLGTAHFSQPHTSVLKLSFFFLLLRISHVPDMMTTYDTRSQMITGRNGSSYDEPARPKS
jgi:hypothetical protein